MCVTPSWRCDEALYKCGQCSTDACNSENEVKPKPKISDIIPPPNQINDLLKANATAIGVISLVIVLTLIWCVIRCCSRKKDAADNEDDYDEYYENEACLFI